MDESKELYERIVQEAVVPFLTRVSNQTETEISCEVKVGADGQWIEFGKIGSPEEGSGVGEIRIDLKPLFAKGRYRFEVEAIVKGVAPKTGFSGFHLRGKVGRGEGKVELVKEGETTYYNVWNWTALP